MSVTIDGTAGVTIPAGGLLTGVGSNSVTTYQISNVTLNSTITYFSGPNTGSIGAAGQKWLIIGHGQFTDTAGVASVGVRIYDGTSALSQSFNRVVTANGYVDCSCFIVVTLSGATTFTLQAADFTSTNGLLIADSAICSSITAVRLS